MHNCLWCIDLWTLCFYIIEHAMYISIYTYINIYHNTISVLWQSNLLSGVPDYFYRNKISSGGDLSHYSSASLY